MLGAKEVGSQLFLQQGGPQGPGKLQLRPAHLGNGFVQGFQGMKPGSTQVKPESTQVKPLSHRGRHGSSLTL